MSSNDCSCDATEPTFVLNPAIGTTPCPEPGATTGTSQSPCPPQACCNFFRTEEANGAQNFIYSAGGPFAFDNVTNLLVAGGGFVDPDVLAGIVCIPNMTPGTYRVDARFEVAANVLASVLVFPDCADPSVSYLVNECLNADATNSSCSGFLYIEITGCSPGFEIYGCGGAIKNFQISFTRVSGRSIVDCGGSDLLPFDPASISCGQ